MSIGIILLIIIGLLIYFEAAQRVLDRLYLSDTMALVVVAAIIAGSFIDIPISSLITINVGGALIPVILAIYVLVRAGTSKEMIRTIIAVVLTAATIYGVSYLFRDFGHGRDIIDPLYVFTLTGGIFAYIFGRTRRGAFVAGTMGYLLYSLIHVWRIITGQVPGQARIGGAGAFSSIIVSGIFGLLLVELIGETRERLQGGPVRGNNKPGKERNDGDEK